jgi:hypothetical protein
MSKPITENIIEQSAIEILQSQGWEYLHGSQTSPPEFPSSGGVRGDQFPSSGGVSAESGRGGSFPSTGGVVEDRGGERESYSQVILLNRLRKAIAK